MTIDGSSKVVRVNLTPSGPAYAAGDVIGGLFELPNVIRMRGAVSIWHSLHIMDRLNQKAPMNLFLLNRRPSNIANIVNNAKPPDWTDGDYDGVYGWCGYIVASHAVAAADYVSIVDSGTPTTIAIAEFKNIGIEVSGYTEAGATEQEAGPGTGTSLWVLAITSGTPTWSGAAVLLADFGFLRD